MQGCHHARRCDYRSGDAGFYPLLLWLFWGLPCCAGRVTLMVNDMPQDDTERAGRIRDNGALLAEGADARMKAIEAVDQQKAPTIGRVMNQFADRRLPGLCRRFPRRCGSRQHRPSLLHHGNASWLPRRPRRVSRRSLLQHPQAPFRSTQHRPRRRQPNRRHPLPHRGRPSVICWRLTGANSASCFRVTSVIRVSPRCAAGRCTTKIANVANPTRNSLPFLPERKIDRPIPRQTVRHETCFKWVTPR